MELAGSRYPNGAIEVMKLDYKDVGSAGPDIPTLRTFTGP
jgi:hypothetical protein